MPPTTAIQAYDWSQDQSFGTQELIVALILENSGEDFEELCIAMAQPAHTPLDFSYPLRDLVSLVETKMAWALQDKAVEHWFWYISANKMEPRVGQRKEDIGADKERPLTIARDIRALHAAAQTSGGETCLDLLLTHPYLSETVRRVLVAKNHTYSEIRESLLCQTMRPIDMLRFKLAFFGAARFDPKSDLWTRITLFQGAPLPEEIKTAKDDWWLAAV